MILTSECKDCIHSSIDESNKAKIKIYCNLKNRTYYWGQCIPCEDKKEKRAMIMKVSFNKLKENAIILTRGSDK